MKAKKLISVLITMAVTSTMFVGCSSEKSVEPTTSLPEKTEAVATETIAEATKEESSKFPITDKPVTYRIVAAIDPGNLILEIWNFSRD